MGGAELYRNTELDPVKRCYPGGVFDPLSLASGNDDEVFRLKEAEIKHGRLAMIAVLGKFASYFCSAWGFVCTIMEDPGQNSHVCTVFVSPGFFVQALYTGEGVLGSLGYAL